MKTIKTLTLWLFGIILICSCKKENETTEPSVGTLKVTVHYTKHTDSVYLLNNYWNRTYSFKDFVKVELSHNNILIATQYLTNNYAGSGTIDFGQYEYGSYSVKAWADEWSSISSLPASYNQHNAYLEQTVDFQIDAITKTVLIELNP